MPFFTCLFSRRPQAIHIQLYFSTPSLDVWTVRVKPPHGQHIRIHCSPMHDTSVVLVAMSALARSSLWRLGRYAVCGCRAWVTLGERPFAIWSRRNHSGLYIWLSHSLSVPCHKYRLAGQTPDATRYFGDAHREVWYGLITGLAINRCRIVRWNVTTRPSLDCGD